MVTGGTISAPGKVVNRGESGPLYVPGRSSLRKYRTGTSSRYPRALNSAAEAAFPAVLSPQGSRALGLSSTSAATMPMPWARMAESQAVTKAAAIPRRCGSFNALERWSERLTTTDGRPTG